MGDLKILRSIEEAILELFVWMILFPITLFDLVVHHVKFLDKMSGEMASSDNKSYETRMSPVSFLVFGVSVPIWMYINSHSFWTKEALASMPKNNDALLAVIILYALMPFSWAVINMLAGSAKFTRSTFRLYFGNQCYVFTPYYVVMFWSSFYVRYCKIILHTECVGILFVGLDILLIASMIWLLVVEWMLLYRAARFLKSVGFYLLGIILSSLAFVIAGRIIYVTGQTWMQ
jgi:hypothetical protein